MSHPAYQITDDMLVAAAKINDLDDALRTVMDQVGITDGGVAGMVFTGEWEAAWPRAGEQERLSMLRHWRDSEKCYDRLFDEPPLDFA